MELHGIDISGLGWIVRWMKAPAVGDNPEILGERFNLWAKAV